MFTLFVPKHVNLSDLWNKFFLLCIFKHFVLFLNGIIFIIERAVLQSVFYAYKCSKKKKATLVIFFYLLLNQRSPFASVHLALRVRATTTKKLQGLRKVSIDPLTRNKQLTYELLFLLVETRKKMIVLNGQLLEAMPLCFICEIIIYQLRGF